MIFLVVCDITVRAILMTREETDLIRRYIAGELRPGAVDVAELLVLVDEHAAAMVRESLIQRDRA